MKMMEWLRAPFGATHGGAKRLSPEGLPVTTIPSDWPNIRLGGIGFNYAQIYASQSNVRLVIDRIAREAAGLTLKMYEKVPRSATAPDSRVELDEHPLAILLQDPTPGIETVFDFYYALFADLCVFDEAKFAFVRDRGTPVALVRIPPPNLIPDRDPTTQRVTGWRGMSGERFTLDQILWMKGYDPATNQGAIPPMESLRQLLQEEHQRDKHREKMWARALRKDGVITRHLDSKTMSDAAKMGFLIDAADALNGNNGYMPFMLEPGMDWKDAMFSPRDMEYLSARKLSRQEAAAMFHVPPRLVASAAGDSQQPNKEDLSLFYAATLPPYLERVESNFEARLLPEFTFVPSLRRKQYVKFNLDEKLRGNFEDRAAIMMSLAGRPLVSLNESRGRLDLPASDQEDADDIVVPGNVLIGGQASPQNPRETPATDAGNLEPAGTTPDPTRRRASNAQTPEEVLAAYEELQRQKEREAVEAALRARVEERATYIVSHHLERQKAARAKSYTDARWTRELREDLFAGLTPLLGVDHMYEDARKSNLEALAAEINMDTEALREDPKTFNGERTKSLAEKITELALHTGEKS